MNNRTADRLIREGQPVTILNTVYAETFTARFVSRDRHNMFTDDRRVFDRAELQLLPQQ